MIQTFILLSLVIVAKFEDKVSYNNFKVYRILPTTKEQVEFLQDINNNDETFSFWKPPTNVNKTVDLMVSPDSISEFSSLMAGKSLKYDLYINDVQMLMNLENISNRTSASKFDWNHYHRLSEINSWLRYLVRKYPDKVKMIVGGRSYQDRKILGVKLSFGRKRPGVFLEGGIHAREWISPATVTYLLNEFLTSKNRAVRALAEKYDWYMFPVCNPDGYVYTYTLNRFWRKTRSFFSIPCRGVDANRNWGYKWKRKHILSRTRRKMIVCRNQNIGGGSSTNPCHSTYAGEAAFSEIETRSLARYIKSISKKLFAYISFHSYSQLLLFPYGHTREHLDNYSELYTIGRKALDALIKKHGTQYRLGNIAEALYVATGSSIDWVKGCLKIPIVYVYELRDKGEFGFLLPANKIIPNGEEVLDSLIALFRAAEKFGYPQRR